MDPVESFLSRLHHPIMAGIDLSLDRMRRLLSIIGSPHKRLPPVVHVAGTNGKGSLIVYLHAILEAAGYRVHRYTSPHLVHFRERILLAGKEIENAHMERLLRYIAPHLTAQNATFFEATTAAAFLAFAETKADIVLLETGLGGRLDATNVIDKPLLTAITPISFDHTEYLGTTLPAIAAEKAGIIKRNVPCIIGRQEAATLEVLLKKSAELSAPVFRLGQKWKVENHYYISPTKTLALAPSLAGEHQFDNAATAVACIEQLPQFTISDDHISTGLASAQWPARLQKLDQHPYAKQLPAGMELYLDGGHNPQGGEVLASWLAGLGKPVYLVCAMMKGKDMKQFLAPIAPHASELVAVPIPQESNAQPASAVAAAAQSLGMQASAAESVEKALQTISAHAKTPSIICICGSLYLAGKVLAVK